MNPVRVERDTGSLIRGYTTLAQPWQYKNKGDIDMKEREALEVSVRLMSDNQLQEELINEPVNTAMYSVLIQAAIQRGLDLVRYKRNKEEMTAKLSFSEKRKKAKRI